MSLPNKLSVPTGLDPRLITKTSLPEPKKAIALLILLWLQSGKPAELAYGKVMSSRNGDIIDDELRHAVTDFISKHSVDLAGADSNDLLQGNPLVTAQMEALNSAFELIWHLASFEFEDSSKNRTTERKGSFRYRKVIHFTCNMDIIDAFAEMDMDKFVHVLCNWLTHGSVSCDESVEVSLIKVLAAFAETSFYKSCSGKTGTVYTPSGIYGALTSGSPVVQLVDDNQEAQGTTRILKSAIKDGLNPYLQPHSSSEVSIAESVSNDSLTAYEKRALNMLSISHIDVTITEPELAPLAEQDESADPHNLIYFGAPGTGKSYELDKRARKRFGKHGEDHIRRVTFHPDYTFAQFVGSYRPGMDYPVDEESGKSLQYQMTHGQIVYRYTAGPFVDSYIQAMTHPKEDYLLIIEEINRANPAAVFGDIFQLLDRDSNGVSEYPVRVSEDLGGYLLKNFVHETHEQQPRDDGYEGLYTAEEGRNWCVRNMRLPGNLYIWATMNSADQGVFPMDTAFKRRWEFKYLGIDEGATYVAGYSVGIGEPRRYVKWDELRCGINTVLKGAKVNEDKLLGPFFIQPTVLNDPLKFAEVFKSKVLLYLYEDAAKMRREKVFSAGSDATYSEVCDEFDRKGEGIFKDFDKLYHKLTVIAEDSDPSEHAAEGETEE